MNTMSGSELSEPRCIFCFDSKLYSVPLEETEYYCLYNITNACREYLPLETTESVKWDVFNGCVKLCRICYEEARELTRLKCVSERLKVEINQKASKINFLIRKAQGPVIQKTSHPVDTINQEITISQVKPIILTRSRKQKIKDRELSNTSTPELLHKIGIRSYINTRTPIYFCETCDLDFATSHQLTCHIRFECEKTTKKLKCKDCPMTFEFQANLDIHYKNHFDAQMPYKCEDCEKRYTALKYLKVHCRKVHFKCEFCLATFKNEKELSLHKVVHENGDPIKCYLCPVVLRTKTQFFLHLNTHKQLQTWKTLETHEPSYKKPKILDYKCDKCQNSFESNQLLLHHQKTNVFCSGKFEPEQIETYSASMEMEEQKSADYYDEEEIPLELNEPQNDEITIECFDPLGNDNSVGIKTDQDASYY